MKKNLSLLVFAPYVMPIHNVFEVAVGYNALWRGVDVSFFGCDGLFPVCDMYRPQLNGPRSSDYCDSCMKGSQAFFSSHHINLNWLGYYKHENDDYHCRETIQNLPSHELLDYHYNGLPLAEWVRSSVYSHFRANVIDINNPEHDKTFRQYLSGGILAVELLNRMFADKKPTHMLVFNGRQSYTKIALELALLREIDVITHERGFLSGTLSIFKNSDCHSKSVYKDLWTEWSDIPLKQKQVQFVERWVHGFATGKSFNGPRFNNAVSNQKLTNFLSQGSGGEFWALFPSTTDEFAATKDHFFGYKNQNQWILDTISFVESKKDIFLIIRAHPAMGSRQSGGINHDEVNFFTNLQDKLPENVLLFLPSDPINSYDILSHISLGLTFGSTLSIEMACRGIPVIAAANTFWSYSSMIELAESAEKYMDLLAKYEKRKLSENEIVNNTKTAYRIAYAYSKRWHLQIPIYKMPDPYKAFLLVNSTEDFKLGKCPELDYATDIVLGERPAIPQNTRLIRPEEFDEEDAAIRRALARFDFFQKAEKVGLLTIILDVCSDLVATKKTIESIFHHKEIQFDLIITLVDEDDSFQKNITHLMSEFPQERIRYVRVPNGKGKAVVRNLAIKQALGEFVMSIEAGEVLSANFFKYFASALDANPHADIFYSKLVKITAGRPELITPPRYVNLKMQAHRNYFTSGAMVRKSLWEAIGGYRESINGLEEWDFYLAALLRGAKFQYMDCPGIISFLRNKQISDNPLIHQSSVYAQMVLNNLAAFSFQAINTARIKLGLPELNNVTVAKYENALDFKISELCVLKEEGKKPNWTNEEMATVINRLLQIRSWELACYMCECLLDHEPQNKQLLAVYAQVLQATNRAAEAAIIQDQINNGRDFPAVSVVPLTLDQWNELA